MPLKRGTYGKQRQRPAKVITAERRAQAVTLRKEGKTFQQIGDEIGVSAVSAWRMIHQALDQLNALLVSETEELRQQQLDQIAALKEVLWKSSKRGELGHVDRMVRLMEREAKLAGLNAAERHEITGRDGKPLEISDVRAKLVAKLKGLAGDGT